MNKNIALNLLREWKSHGTLLDVVFSSPFTKLCDATGVVAGFSGLPGPDDAFIVSLSSGAQLIVFINDAQFGPDIPTVCDVTSLTQHAYTRTLCVKQDEASCYLLERQSERNAAA